MLHLQMKPLNIQACKPLVTPLIHCYPWNSWSHSNYDAKSLIPQHKFSLFASITFYLSCFVFKILFCFICGPRSTTNNTHCRLRVEVNKHMASRMNMVLPGPYCPIERHGWTGHDLQYLECTYVIQERAPAVLFSYSLMMHVQRVRSWPLQSRFRSHQQEK